jgi:hypothetical protein
MASFKDHPPLKVEALRELIEGGGEPFKQTPRSYVLWCPETSCKRQKLHVEKTTGLGKCFRCGFKGWASYVLARVYGRSSEELEQLLYGIVSAGTLIEQGFTVPDFWGEEQAEDALLPSTPTYPPEMAPDPMWVDLETSEVAVNYLAQRGLPLDLAKYYGIKFHPADQRVVFPVVVDGLLRGWQGRYIHKTEVVAESGRVIRIPKVITTGKLGKECLMFQDRLVGSRVAVLTEGPFDALKCHLIGGNVATMGKDVSTRQLDIIVRAGVKRLYVGLDPDADRETVAIVRKLNGIVEMRRLLPPAHRDDLGDCTMDEVWAQALEAPVMTAGHAEFYVPMPGKWGG